MPPQEPLSAPPELPDAEQDNAKRQVYFLTFPHPRAGCTQDGTKLVAPEMLSKREIVKKVLDACETPIFAHDHMSISMDISMMAVFCKRSTHCHFHVALKSVSSFRFAPVKKALLARHGLATHWSCTQSGYWSPIRYCTVP